MSTEDEQIKELLEEIRAYRRRNDFESGYGLDRRLKVFVEGAIQSPEFALKLFDDSMKGLEADTQFRKLYADLHRSFGQLPDLTQET